MKGKAVLTSRIGIRWIHCPPWPPLGQHARLGTLKDNTPRVGRHWKGSVSTHSAVACLCHLASLHQWHHHCCLVISYVPGDTNVTSTGAEVTVTTSAQFAVCPLAAQSVCTYVRRETHSCQPSFRRCLALDVLQRCNRQQTLKGT